MKSGSSSRRRPSFRQPKLTPIPLSTHVDSNHKATVVLSVLGQSIPNVDDVPESRAIYQKTLDNKKPLSESEFNDIIEDIKRAINSPETQPILNEKGTSGSYFMRSQDRSIRGIFKPYDEDPYGPLNPKMAKWIQRYFLSPIVGFGRPCLIPQFSYLSEVGAALVDQHLGTRIVPKTELVEFSSPAFSYSRKQRNAHVESLPGKQGSFQMFLSGFTDLSNWIEAHPFPSSIGPYVQGDGVSSGIRLSQRQRHYYDRLEKSMISSLDYMQRRLSQWFTFTSSGTSGERESLFNQESQTYADTYGSLNSNEPHTSYHDQSNDQFIWTPEVLESFRYELEKLVVLDYLIRNTDRGTDNFMIRIDPNGQVHLAAIDNSLSFPHMHPNGLRKYQYGWLYLPEELIDQPFSDACRSEILPLLTSPLWWQNLVTTLHNLFQQHPDFDETQFNNQIAVMKGQAWNLIQTLENYETPVDLSTKTPKLIYEEMVDLNTLLWSDPKSQFSNADQGHIKQDEQDQQHISDIEQPNADHENYHCHCCALTYSGPQQARIERLVELTPQRICCCL